MNFHRTIVFQVAKVFVITNLIVIFLLSLLPMMLLSNRFDSNIKYSLKSQFGELKQLVESGENQMINEAIEKLNDDGYIIVFDRLNTTPKGQGQNRIRPRPAIPFLQGSFVKVGGANERQVLFYTDIIDNQKVFLGKNIEDFEKTKLGFIFPIIIINGSLMFVFIFIARLLSKGIMKPITAVSDYLKSIKHNSPGDKPGKSIFNQDQAIKTLYHEDQPQEIGILTQAFDEAMIQIHQSVLREKEFLQDASHELRTPLTGILSSLELIDTHNLTVQQQQKLKTIKLLSSKLKTITDELLYLTRGKTAHTTQANNIAQVVQSILESYKDSLETRGLTIKLDIQDNLIVEANPADIQKLIGNLIDNAIKYSKDQESIHIQIINNTLIIQDHGIGISPNILEKLGERFIRDSQAMQLNYEGVGLGLSIVYKIIGNYGRDIQVDSMVGEGTTITISF